MSGVVLDAFRGADGDDSRHLCRPRRSRRREHHQTKLSAFAYSSCGVVDYVDYSDTLHVYMTTGTPGFDVVGLSGHDYAPPSAVPEPASWAAMLIGFGLAGGALRRARGDCHPRRSREAARSGTLDVVLDPSGRRAAVSRRHGRRP